MNNVSKIKAIIIHSLVLTVCMFTSTIHAQQTVIDNSDDNYIVVQEHLAPEFLEQILAPIALYPDALLSQILVAATYPIEVVQAARWRQDNNRLSETKALAAIQYKDWDPSVKALVPFTDLIIKLSNDLDWLQLIGDAFLQDEYQVLASIQELRQRAYYEGSIADNDYYHVIFDNGNIIIESTNRELIYVPYYDSRVVYGHWKWKNYQPIYWRHPAHYRLHAGFYWSNKFYIRPTIFFGGFRWGLRSLVINQHFYERPYSRNNRFRNIGISKYRKWKHNPVHRRGVKYSRFGGKKSFRNNQFSSRSKVLKQTKPIIYNKRQVGNRSISNNVVRSRTGINRNDQRRTQQQINNRVQQSGVRNNGKASIVKRQTINGKNVNINRNTPRQQAVKQSKKTNQKSASIGKIQSNKTSINRKYNTSKKSYTQKKSNNSSFNRRTSSAKPLYNTSRAK